MYDESFVFLGGVGLGFVIGCLPSAFIAIGDLFRKIKDKINKE